MTISDFRFLFIVTDGLSVNKLAIRTLTMLAYHIEHTLLTLVGDYIVSLGACENIYFTVARYTNSRVLKTEKPSCSTRDLPCPFVEQLREVIGFIIITYAKSCTLLLGFCACKKSLWFLSFGLLLRVCHV